MEIFFLLQILSKYQFFCKRSVTGVVSYVFLSYSLRLGARSRKKWSICACPTFDTWPGEIKERRNWDLAWASKQCRHSDWNNYKKRRNAISSDWQNKQLSFIRICIHKILYDLRCTIQTEKATWSFQSGK